MSIIERIKNLATWSAPTVGSRCHPISLTADEGTWVKLEDFAGHLNVVFIIFESLNDAETDQWLKDWARHVEPFESIETAIFGITTSRTDELRRYRTENELGFLLLYDPLAIESRAMRCSSRLKPTCKTSVIGVGKDGKVVYSERGQRNPTEVIDVFARIEGRSASPIETPEVLDTVNETAPTETTASAVQNIDSEKAEALITTDNAGYILVDVRTRSEYDADHSPHAIHLPIDELPHRHEELKQTSRIICVCQAGGRSAAAAEFLASIGGTEIYNVEGGMSAWAGERVTGGQLQS
jgi:rhodanese-related sulfurtransferase/peroxiredoxin